MHRRALVSYESNTKVGMKLNQIIIRLSGFGWLSALHHMADEFSWTGLLPNADSASEGIMGGIEALSIPEGFVCFLKHAATWIPIVY